MRLLPVVQRLRDAKLLRVQGALELAGLQGRPAHLPARFVVPLGDSAKPNATSGVHDQALTVQLGVVSVLAAGQAGAEQVSDALQDELDAVLLALAGWTHPEAAGPLQYVGGRPLEVAAGAMVWLSTFSAPARLRKDEE